MYVFVHVSYVNISSIYNSKASASELIENLKIMLPRYYMGISKSSTTHQCVTKWLNL